MLNYLFTSFIMCRWMWRFTYIRRGLFTWCYIFKNNKWHANHDLTSRILWLHIICIYKLQVLVKKSLLDAIHNVFPSLETEWAKSVSIALCFGYIFCIQKGGQRRHFFFVSSPISEWRHFENKKTMYPESETFWEHFFFLVSNQ